MWLENRHYWLQLLKQHPLLYHQPLLQLLLRLYLRLLPVTRLHRMLWWVFCVNLGLLCLYLWFLFLPMLDKEYLIVFSFEYSGVLLLLRDLLECCIMIRWYDIGSLYFEIRKSISNNCTWNLLVHVSNSMVLFDIVTFLVHEQVLDSGSSRKNRNFAWGRLGFSWVIAFLNAKVLHGCRNRKEEKGFLIWSLLS